RGRTRRKRGPRQRGPRREHPMLRLVSAGDQPQVVGAQYFVDRLEVRGATEGAVTGATGGHALSLVARDERATRVTRLGADVGAGQTGDGALRVTHGLVEGLDLAAVPAGGGTRAADRRADRGHAGAGDDASGAVVHVDPRAQRVTGTGADEGVVVARERRAGEGAAGRRRGGAGGAAVAGGHEAALHGESDRATTAITHVVGVAADDVHEGAGLFDGLHDLDVVTVDPGRRHELLGLRGRAGRGGD